MQGRTPKPPYYPTLEAELARRGITRRMLYACLGLHPRSVQYRLEGKIAFPLVEAQKIRDTYFLGWTLEDLFFHPDTP